jgi:hypothetical protein
MPPVVVCTVTGKCLPVLEASMKAYAPEVDLISHKVERSTFGECYNAAMEQEFQSHDEIIIANDDIVLTPTTYQTLMEDVEILKRQHGKLLGFVGACADNTRLFQNIRYNDLKKRVKVQVLAPLLAWVSKEAFQAAQFPPINWFSDDIICLDLNKRGFTHYASRAYVHHAGSQTIGPDQKRLYHEALKWIKENRKDLIPFMK